MTAWIDKNNDWIAGNKKPRKKKNKVDESKNKRIPVYFTRVCCDDPSCASENVSCVRSEKQFRWYKCKDCKNSYKVPEKKFV